MTMKKRTGRRLIKGIIAADGLPTLTLALHIHLNPPGPLPFLEVFSG